LSGRVARLDVQSSWRLITSLLDEARYPGESSPSSCPDRAKTYILEAAIMIFETG
jgi:hypothetical protein